MDGWEETEQEFFFISLDVGDKSQRDKSLEKSLTTVCVCFKGRHWIMLVFKEDRLLCLAPA